MSLILAAIGIGSALAVGEAVNLLHRKIAEKLDEKARKVLVKDAKKMAIRKVVSEEEKGKLKKFAIKKIPENFLEMDEDQFCMKLQKEFSRSTCQTFYSCLKEKLKEFAQNNQTIFRDFMVTAIEKNKVGWKEVITQCSKVIPELQRIEKELLVEHDKRKHEHEEMRRDTRREHQRLENGMEEGFKSLLEQSKYHLERVNKNYSEIREMPSRELLDNFVNRLREVEQFNRNSESPVIIVSGTGGMGKSALAARIREIVDGKGVTTFWHEMKASDLREDILSELAVFLKDVGEDPALAGQINACRRDEVVREKAEALVHTLINSLSRNRYVLFFDNYQIVEKDGTMDSMFTEIVRHLETSTLIFTTREERDFMKNGIRLAGDGDLGKKSGNLTPLPPGDAGNLIEKDVKRKPGKKVTDEIYRVTGGVPVYLKLVTAKITEDNLEDEDVLEELQDIREGEMEDYFRKEIYDPLADEEKEILHILAVARTPVKKSLFDFMLDTEWKDTRKISEALKRRALVKGRYEIHDVLREFVSMEIDLSEKEAIHELISDWYIEKITAKDDEKTPEDIIELTHHLLGAGREKKAAELMVENGVWLKMLGYVYPLRELYDCFHAENLEKEPWADILVQKASILETHGEFDSALKSLKEAQEIYEEAGNREGFSTCLNNIGAIYYARDDYESALKNYSQALKINEELGDRSGMATLLNNIGLIYYERGDYESALKNYEQALKIDEELGDGSNMATDLNNIGEIYRARGDYESALQNYRKALKITEELGNRRNEATFLNNIGLIYCARGDYKSALLNYRKALKIAEELGNRKKEATLLNNIGMIYRARDDYDRALLNYRKALKIAKELGDKSSTATFLNNIGCIYESRGDYESALPNYEKVLKIAEELGNRKKEATSLNNIATIHKARGDSENALKNYEQVLKIFEELGDRSGMATLLNNIGLIYYTRNDYDYALKNYEQALKIFKELGAQSEAATLLNNIGGIYKARGDYASALSNFEKALKIDEELGAVTDAAVRLHNIGTVFIDKGEFEKALEYFKRVRKIYEKAGMQKSVDDVEGWIKITEMGMNKTDEERIFGLIAEELQSGKSVDEIVKELVDGGVPREVVEGVVQEIARQLEGSEQHRRMHGHKGRQAR